MIKAYCDNKKCRKRIQGAGAIANSPPKILPNGRMSQDVKKFHFCKDCWKKILRMMGWK